MTQIPEEVAKRLVEESGLAKHEIRFFDVMLVEVVTRQGIRIDHPFTIGPRHVAYASDHGGSLDDDVCRRIPCAHRGCKWAYDDHLAKWGIALRIPFVDALLEQHWPDIQPEMLKLKELCEASKYEVSGFGFVDIDHARAREKHG